MELDKVSYEDAPLVSIVMCAYNGMPFIEEAINCVLNQTYKNWELLISDDGSTDSTRMWLKENFANHPQIKLYFQKENLGYVLNKNFVHQQARGIYITQLDNDDTSSFDRIEKQLKVIRLNPSIRIVACGYLRIDDKGIVYDEVSPPKDIILEHKPRGGYPFWFPCLLIHRSIFDKIGYFNEYFSGALGDDLYWTIHANKVSPIYCLSEKLYGYRNNPGSITNVYGNIRKLIMPEILNILLLQQEKKGTDWLAEKDLTLLKEKEKELINNRRFMSEQYRISAARAIDKGDKILARRLLIQAWKRMPLNLKIYKTILYYTRFLQ